MSIDILVWCVPGAAIAAAILGWRAWSRPPEAFVHACAEQVPALPAEAPGPLSWMLLGVTPSAGGTDWEDALRLATTRTDLARWKPEVATNGQTCAVCGTMAFVMWQSPRGSWCTTCAAERPGIRMPEDIPARRTGGGRP